MEGVTIETVHKLSRREFFNIWHTYEKKNRNEELLKYVMDKFKISNLSENGKNSLKATIKSFSLKISERWEKSARKVELFKVKYGEWLNGSDLELLIIAYSDVQPSTSGAASLGGRPTKSFKDSGEKTKKRKVQHLLDSTSVQELTFATEVAVRSEGKRDAANIFKELSSASPKRATKLKLSLQKTDMRVYSSEEALALFVDCKLTTHSYKLMRKRAMSAGHFLYPSYYSLQKSKTDCCPSEEFVTVTETSAEISLQAILDLTVQRLVRVQDIVIKHFLSLNVTNFNLISKWGCDGSSGHSRYKQKFSDQSSDDDNLFVFCFVPIKMQAVEDDNMYAWQNPRTSSTRLCRPIKFLFVKETREITLNETKLIQDQIKNLRPTKITVDNSEITIHHQMLLTMVDGKVCNSLTETRSSQTCYICGATPKMMNLDHVIDSQDKRENYGFGLSTLHAWIRSFECLLHISYRLDIKTWQVKTEPAKAAMQQRKAEIQNKFKTEMGLLIDRPKPGFGSTNDGNTARRFFRNPQKSSEITGLDANLINRFSVILQALSSGYEINIMEFEKYATETKAVYLSLYPWYYMPVTVHKLLIHSSDIIQQSVLPIGQLSEEAQEARNKDCRRFREFHTQKRSRTATNKDLIRMLLITSDPVINSYRDLPKKSAGSIPAEVLNLLNSPNIPSQPQRFSNLSSKDDADVYIVEDSTESEVDDTEYDSH